MTTELKVNDSSLPLRRDVKLMGKMLGEILVDHGGPELLEKVDKIVQPASIESAILKFKDHDISEEIIQKTLNTLSLELIITAHPTEATKRSILEIQQRIAAILKNLDHPLLTDREQKKLEDRL